MAFPIVFRPGRSQLTGDPFWSSVDRLVEDLWRSNAAQTQAAGFSPRLEVVERPNEFVVSAELPGIEEKAVDVEVHGNVLTLRGEKRVEKSEEQEGRHFTERVYGEFRRSIELPVDVQADKATASFKNGVLTIHLPKAEAAKVRHIPVNGGRAESVAAEAGEKSRR
jgi:HSP20 family protein